MDTVVLCGGEEGQEPVHTLFDVLRAAGFGTLYVTERSASFLQPAAGADFLVLDSAALREVNAPRGVALFRPQAPEKRPRLPSGFYAVVDSDDPGTAAALQNAGFGTVLCGLSQKNTVTFSSIGSENAVVSLQRGLATLRGGDAGPVEVPVAFGRPRGSYALLAAVAVVLLAGKALPEGGLVLP